MQDDTNQQVAFLGLGIMGGPMSAHLASGGWAVRAWNRTAGRPGQDLASSAGAKICPSIAQTVSSADIIFTCLSDVPDVEEVLFSADGVSDNAPSGALIIDMSTIGPQAARAIAIRLQTKNLRFLDAPVTGGDIGARNATLTIMAGGQRTDYDQALPLLNKLGQKITYCGPSGSGQALKLCNQILCAINMVSICEAISLSESLGLDQQLLIDVLTTGAGGSWALNNLGPKILSGDLAPAFMIKDMLKDLRLVEENCSCAASDLPGVELAQDLFNEASKLGSDREGTQAMIRAYRK